MASVNKVILVGNLGADPETRYTQGGDAICSIRMATTDSYKDKTSGEKREVTEWHRVVLYRKLGEVAGQYLRKGSQVYIEGKIKTRKWQDKDGQDRYTTEIEADTLQMLGSRGDGGQRQQSGGDDYQPAPQRQGGGGGKPASRNFDDLGDDIPFADCAVEFDIIGRRLARRIGRV